MKRLFSTLSNVWAYGIVETLYRMGMSDICIAPGSRSSALVAAASECQELRIHTHIDERSLGFVALGIAVSSRRPVGIITTSGTAVANLFPVVIEAFMARVPLILLTADRPSELIDVGANQTIFQKDFFSPYVIESLHFPDAEAMQDDDQMSRHLNKIIDCFRSTKKYSRKGPVHINIPFKKPFTPLKKGSSFDMECHQFETQVWSRDDMSSPTDVPLDNRRLETFLAAITSNPPMLLVVGWLRTFDERQAVLHLAEHLSCVILPDVMSQLRFYHHERVINNVVARIDSGDHSFFGQCVVYVGDHLTSEALHDVIRRSTKVFQIVDDDRCQDPWGCVSETMIGSIIDTCDYLISHIDMCHTHHIMDPFHNGAYRETEYLDVVKHSEHLSEPWVVHTLVDMISDDMTLMVSNSLPIRIMDKSVFARFSGFLYANRGASGIDGILSTALGFGIGSHGSVVLVIGDMAVQHDIGALMAIAASDVPMMIVCLNNNGGGIFSHLPIAERSDLLEAYFTMPQSIDFGMLAKGMGMRYRRIDDRDACHVAFLEFVSNSRSIFLDISVDTADTLHIYKQMGEIK